MKTTIKLTNEIMGLIQKEVESLNSELCSIIDTLTDGDCNAILKSDTILVERLQEVAFKVYKQAEQVEWDKIEINAQHKANNA